MAHIKCLILGIMVMKKPTPTVIRAPRLRALDTGLIYIKLMHHLSRIILICVEQEFPEMVTLSIMHMVVLISLI